MEVRLNQFGLKIDYAKTRIQECGLYAQQKARIR